MLKSLVLDAFFPKTPQLLLSTFLLQSERRWYLSELARYLESKPSALERELASLTQAGVLRREADGNRVYYQADPNFPLQPELRGIFAKTTGAIPEIGATIDPLLDRIAYAFVFGSTARGEQTAKSDIDLMLVGDIPLATLALPLRRLEETLGVEVNVSLYGFEELRSKWQAGNHFLRTVLDGRKIFLKGSEDELANALGEPARAGASDEQARTG